MILLVLILIFGVALCACTDDKPGQDHPSDQAAPALPTINGSAEPAAPVATGSDAQTTADPGTSQLPAAESDNPTEATAQPVQTGSPLEETETEDPDIQENVEVTVNGEVFFGGGG